MVDQRNDGYKRVEEYVRPSDYLGDKFNRRFALYGEKGVMPSGIYQGALGNCYFLSAASALAEDPKRIQKLFQNKYYSKSGMFMVTFYMRGDQHRITIDD
jgi:hypothetical protein